MPKKKHKPMHWQPQISLLLGNLYNAKKDYPVLSEDTARAISIALIELAIPDPKVPQLKPLDFANRNDMQDYLYKMVNTFEDMERLPKKTADEFFKLTYANLRKFVNRNPDLYSLLDEESDEHWMHFLETKSVKEKRREFMDSFLSSHLGKNLSLDEESLLEYVEIMAEFDSIEVRCFAAYRLLVLSEMEGTVLQMMTHTTNTSNELYMMNLLYFSQVFGQFMGDILCEIQETACQIRQNSILYGSEALMDELEEMTTQPGFSYVEQYLA